MARPTSDTNRHVAELITKHMTEYPQTSRQQMINILVDQLQLTHTAAGYYIDRACRPIFKALHNKPVAEPSNSDV